MGDWKSTQRRHRVTNTPEEDSYEGEEPVILESRVKAPLEVSGGDQSPGVNGIPIELPQATEAGAVKILTSICGQIGKTKQWLTPWKVQATSLSSTKEMPWSAVTAGPVALASDTGQVRLRAMQQRLLPSVEQEVRGVPVDQKRRSPQVQVQMFAAHLCSREFRCRLACVL